MWRELFAAALCGLLVSVPAVAEDAPAATRDPNAIVPQTWQMLDYMAVDYAGAVNEGAVISTSEYAEEREFAATARARIQSLPPTAATPALLAEADALIALVAAKAAPAQVALQAHALADALLQAYPVPTAPESTPDLERGAALYHGQCLACHGAGGAGDGPVGITLSPPPINFTDQGRADQRSALSLYEVISQGVEGTPMAAFGSLSPADRWALAYYVGSLAYAHEAVAGPSLWQQDPTARAEIANLADLSRARVAQLARPSASAVRGPSSATCAPTRTRRSRSAAFHWRARASPRACPPIAPGRRPKQPNSRSRPTSTVSSRWSRSSTRATGRCARSWRPRWVPTAAL